MNKYQLWIDENVDNPHLKCAEYTLQMQEIFPELIRIRGYYHDPFDGKQPHWWLSTSNGLIVDPTASQFNPLGHYEPYDESLGEPKGKCMNCGELSYFEANICSDICGDELHKYWNS